jgi:hypothetical protein
MQKRSGGWLTLSLAAGGSGPNQQFVVPGTAAGFTEVKAWNTVSRQRLSSHGAPARLALSSYRRGTLRTEPLHILLIAQLSMANQTILRISRVSRI